MAPLTLVAETFAPSALSALITYIALKWWLAKAPLVGLLGRDMNKPDRPEVVEAGGLAVVLGAAFGVMAVIALRVYVWGTLTEVQHFAIVLVLLLAGLLGFLDDLLGWKRGISRTSRVLLTAPIALPLVVIKSGVSIVHLPLVGTVDLGPLYALVLVPIGIMGASNAFNMLAGYNGLEAGQAVILTLSAATFCALKGIRDVVPLLLPMLTSLLVFLRYNLYPARAFPGNVLTYSFGAYFASMVVVGNFEKFGLTVFVLYFVELALFLRGLANGVYKENFGLPRPDGSLEPPYDKCYSLTHVAIKLLKATRGRATERGVVLLVWLLQALVCVISIVVYT